MFFIVMLVILFFIAMYYRRNLVYQLHECKRIETVLTTEKERIHKYLNIAGVVLICLDHQGNISFINYKGLQLLGYSDEKELIGKNWFDTCVPEQWRSTVYEVFEKIMSGNLALVEYYENPILTKAGQERTFAWHNSLLVGPHGEIEGVISSGEDITERLQTEAALRESEERFRMLIENINIGIFMTHLDGKIILANQAMADMGGYGCVEEILQISAQNLYADEADRDRFITYLQKYGFVKNMEVRYVRKDGTIHWAMVNAVIMKDRNGTMSILGSSQDITFRKMAEEAIRLSEAKYRGLYSEMTEGVCLHELIFDNFHQPVDYQIIDVNPAYESITGIPKEKAIGSKASDIYGTEMPPYFDIYANVAMTGKSTSFETYFAPMNKHFFISVFSPLPNQFATVFTDITEKKNAQIELMNMKAMLEAAFEQTPVPMALADADGTIKIVNSAAKKIWGIEDELNPVGANLLSYQQSWKDFDEDDNELTIKDMPLALALKGIVTKDKLYRIIRKDGSRRWGLVSGTPIYNDTGTLIAGFMVFPDITDRMQIENDIKKLNQELIEKNKELEQIVYVTSHDLRSPLVNIQGFSKELQISFQDLFELISTADSVELVQEKLNSYIKPDILSSLEFIFKSTSKMDSLLSGLLRLSRLGRMEFTIKKLSMNEFISDIIQTFEFKIKQTHTTVELNNLPDCYGDSLMMSQVFSNLIDNSLKFLSPERDGMIRISGFTNDNEIVYCVEDNGIGISEAYHSKIFEIFHRLDQKVQGEGLGLTIIKKIIEKHHGRIWVESELGKGSKFFVSLPRITNKTNKRIG